MKRLITTAMILLTAFASVSAVSLYHSSPSPKAVSTTLNLKTKEEPKMTTQNPVNVDEVSPVESAPENVEAETPSESTPEQPPVKTYVTEPMVKDGDTTAPTPLTPDANGKVRITVTPH